MFLDNINKAGHLLVVSLITLHFFGLFSMIAVALLFFGLFYVDYLDWRKLAAIGVAICVSFGSNMFVVEDDSILADSQLGYTGNDDTGLAIPTDSILGLFETDVDEYGPINTLSCKLSFTHMYDTEEIEFYLVIYEEINANSFYIIDKSAKQTHDHTTEEIWVHADGTMNGVLNASTTYGIGVIMGYATGLSVLQRLANTVGEEYVIHANMNAPTPSVPNSHDFNQSYTQNKQLCAYVNYTLGGFVNSLPVIDNENPSSGDYNISTTQVYNVTVTDANSNNSIVDFYISTDNSTWTHLQTNNSILNESVSVDLTGQLSYDTFYYMKITANDINDNVTFYSNFETTPYRSGFFNTSFSSENWVGSNTNMSFETGYYNLTVSSGGNVFLDDFVGNDGTTLSDAGNWSDGGGDYEWIYDDDGTPSSNTGASAAALATTPGTDYLFTEASGKYAKHYYLDSDNFTGTYNITVDFYYHMYGSDMGTLSVQIWDGSSWDTIWTKSGQQHASSSVAFGHAYAYSKNGDSHPYTGTTKIRFDGLTGATYKSDMCIAYVNINTTGSIDGDIITKNITKTDTNWDKFYADVNNTANSTFSLIDPTDDDHTIISGLVGDGDDISSVTNSTVRVKGEFNATLSLDSINLTWTAESGEEPYHNLSVRADDVDYFIWFGDNCTLSDVGENVTGFNGAAETISIWNSSWISLTGTGSGDGDEPVHTFDVIKIDLDDSGNISINVTLNENVNYDVLRNVTLDSGYNYAGWSNSTASTLKDINTNATWIALWVNYSWSFWIEGVTPDVLNKNIAQDDVLAVFTAGTGRYIEI